MKTYTLRNTQATPLPPTKHEDGPAIGWFWSTYTICGIRFRFQGRPTAQNQWYIHVCRLDNSEWVRISYGYIDGATLPDCCRAWTLAYVSSLS